MYRNRLELEPAAVRPTAIKEATRTNDNDAVMVLAEVRKVSQPATSSSQTGASASATERTAAPVANLTSPKFALEVKLSRHGLLR